MTAPTAEAAQHWREWIQVHPAADDVPMMDDAGLKRLADSIARNGLRVPITLCAVHTPGEDYPRVRGGGFTRYDRIFKLVKAGKLLVYDGRNRLGALWRWHRDHPNADADADVDVDDDGWCQTIEETLREARIEVIGADSGHEAVDYVEDMNLNRRQLTEQQQSATRLSQRERREAIAAALKATPEKSDRAIADDIGTTNKTVAAARAKLEAGEEIPHPEKRVGKDGVAQSATKPATTPPLPPPVTPDAETWGNQAERVVKPQPDNVFERVSEQDLEVINAASLEVRAAIVRGMRKLSEGDAQIAFFQAVHDELRDLRDNGIVAGDDKDLEVEDPPPPPAAEASRILGAWEKASPEARQMMIKKGYLNTVWAAADGDQRARAVSRSEGDR